MFSLGIISLSISCFFKMQAERGWSWEVQAIGWDLVCWWISWIHAVNVYCGELYASSFWNHRWPYSCTHSIYNLSLEVCQLFLYDLSNLLGRYRRKKWSLLLALCFLYWWWQQHMVITLLIIYFLVFNSHGLVSLCICRSWILKILQTWWFKGSTLAVL